MASTIDRTTVLAHFEALSADDKWWVAENMMSILKGAGPIKPRGRKTKSIEESSEDGKKRSKVNLHHVLTKFVKPVLDSAESTDAAAKKLMAKGRVQRAVAQRLVDQLKDVSEDKALESLSNEDTIMSAFSAWQQTPEANIPRKPRSTASSGSETKTNKPKLSSMSEEEKKAFYKARGEAAAAARAAKKAKSATETQPKPAPVEDDDDDASSVSSTESSDSEAEMEPEEVRPYVWEHAMEGKPITKYERVDIEGSAYLYDIKNKKFLGMWNEKKNKIKKDVEDPCA